MSQRKHISELRMTDLQQELGTNIVGKKFYTFDRVSSTNKVAKRLAKNLTENAGAVVVAEQQTKGRGRLNRVWASAPGVGIWCSIILSPETSLKSQSILSLSTALSVAKAIESLGLKPELKWPNDVLIDSKKVCGVLIETETSSDKMKWIVIGIGVNVNQNPEDFPEDIREKCTSLKMAGGRAFDRSGILKLLLQKFEDDYLRLLNGDSTQLLQEWRDRCPLLKRPVALQIGSEMRSGIFEDVDEQGRLLLRTNGTVQKINAGVMIMEGESHAAGR